MWHSVLLKALKSRQRATVYLLLQFTNSIWLCRELIQIELVERELPKQKPPFCAQHSSLVVVVAGIQMRRFEGITNFHLSSSSPFLYDLKAPNYNPHAFTTFLT